MLDRFRIWLLRVGSRPFLKKPKDLINLRGKEVESCEDTAIRAEIILLHNFFVVDGVANVDVAVEGDISDSGVEIDHVGWCAFGVEVGVYSLHEGRLA